LAAAVESIEELPNIDDRLALPEAGYEIIDGVVTFVAPADPPHAERHHTVSMLIGACARADFKVAIDMLTRTSRIDDIAPDVSVFPGAPHPVTGGRQLEQLAFEIVSTESMSLATKKAAKLAGRGVRRVFAIDLQRARVVEWSRELESWIVLDVRGAIDDPALAVPLSVGALVEAASTDDEVARALTAKHNPVIETMKAESHADGLSQGRREAQDVLARTVVDVLITRRISFSGAHRERILGERELSRLAEWARLASVCTNVEELFE